MAKLLTDKRYAVTGKLVAIDATGLVGPFFTIRVPAKGYDLHRPATYIDLKLLDPGQVVFKSKIHINDDLRVIINPSAAVLEKGTRNQLTYEVLPRSNSQRISHAVRKDDATAPINGKVIDNDERKHIVIDAGLPLVVGLLDAKPSQVKLVKINSWVTFWPAPPTHGIILPS
ncbi:MAG: hypothetical protein JXQ73_17865 [Phycisphaerae bacterium]|nr:hypothetical protein [Phycisphaerae bacterium]